MPNTATRNALSPVVALPVEVPSIVGTWTIEDVRWSIVSAPVHRLKGANLQITYQVTESPLDGGAPVTRIFGNVSTSDLDMGGPAYSIMEGQFISATEFIFGVRMVGGSYLFRGTVVNDSITGPIGVWVGGPITASKPDDTTDDNWSAQAQGGGGDGEQRNKPNNPGPKPGHHASR
jgi:hypothetical protein